MRIGIRVGGVLAVVAVVVVIITQVGGGSSGVPSPIQEPTCPPPAHPGLHVVRPGCSRQPAPRGPRACRSRAGPKLATLLNAATGQTIDGVQCQAGEQIGHPCPHPPHRLRERPGQGDPLRHRHPRASRPSRRRQGPFVETGQLLLLAPRARQRRDHPRRVAERGAWLHPRPVLRRVGRPAQHAPRSGPPRAR